MEKKAVILNDTSYELEHGCRIVMANIKYLLNKRNFRVIDTNLFGINWETNKEFISNMQRSDIAIINGEGTIHHNQQEGLRLVKVAEYCRKSKIPVVLINSVYQDNREEFIRYMKDFDLIFVRESLSKDELDKWGIRSEVVPDMTLFNDTANPSDILKGNAPKKVGFTDSAFIDLSEKLWKYSQMSKNYCYLPMILPYKIEGKINPRSIFKKIRYECRNAFNFLQKAVFRKDLNHIYEKRGYYIDSTSEYIKTICNLRILITGRFHALCFALRMKTPFLALSSNSHKIEGILKDIGLNNERIVRFENLNEQIFSQFDGFTGDELTKISIYTNGANKKIEDMFGKIRNLAR